MRWLALVLWSVPLLACSAEQNAVGAGGGAAAGGSSAGGAGGFVPGTGGGGGSVPDCSEEVRPIFVMTHETPATIHSFDPPSLTFTSLLQVDCPDTLDWKVSSMAIDRGYHAWVQWGALADGPDDSYFKRLDRIDLATGVCEPNYGQGQVVSDWGGPLGMAFVSTAEGSDIEQLFFVDKAVNLYQLGGQTTLGQYYDFKPGEGTSFSGVELTGTGEGRLFNLIMNWTPEWDHPCTAQDPCPPTVHLGEVNKGDGTAISNTELPNVPAMGISPGGFAFAHWGGRFWIFESLDFGPTEVYEYDPIANEATLVKSDGPDGVVGAGVSTCAPLALPR